MISGDIRNVGIPDSPTDYLCHLRLSDAWIDTCSSSQRNAFVSSWKGILLSPTPRSCQLLLSTRNLREQVCQEPYEDLLSFRRFRQSVSKDYIPINNMSVLSQKMYVEQAHKLCGFKFD